MFLTLQISVYNLSSKNMSTTTKELHRDHLIVHINSQKLVIITV